MAVAIHRVGKVFAKDGGFVVSDWHIGPGIEDPPPPIWTVEDLASLVETMLPGAAAVEINGDTEIFSGWTLAQLAELSIALGEGATLP